MGQLSIQASTSTGQSTGSSISNHKNFVWTFRRWEKHPGIKHVKVAQDGLSCEAEWLNGDRRWMQYTPHNNEQLEKL